MDTKGTKDTKDGTVSERTTGTAATKARHPAAQVVGSVLFLVCFVSFVSLVTAQQAERGRTEALVRRATERMRALQREADQLAGQEQTLLGDLRKLEVERQLRREELKRVDAQIAQVATDLTAASDRIHQLEARDAAERPGLQARLVEMYKLGRGRYLRMLLGTQDLRAIGHASRTVAALAELDRRRVAEHQRTLADLRSSRAELQAWQKELEGLRAMAARAEAAAARAAESHAALVRDIDRRRDLNAQLAGELHAAQQKLQLALRDVAGGAATDASLPLRPFRGDLPWPVNGGVRLRFGRPAAPGAPASNGMEFAAAEGAFVAVVHDGIVAFADTFGGFGNLVIVDHGAQAFSLYGYLLDIAVKRGARLERGQHLGTVGASPTGRAGLYFELRVDGQPVDPLQWLRKR